MLGPKKIKQCYFEGIPGVKILSTIIYSLDAKMNLKFVLDEVGNMGITFNITKCKFFVKDVKYIFLNRQR